VIKWTGLSVNVTNSFNFTKNRAFMPIKQSAKKYMRVTERKTAVNKRVKGVLKATIRNTKEVASGKVTGDAKASFKAAQVAIDKAAKRGIIKKNTAARRKSHLNALLKKAAK
jgi:small subunit ribosomal protein S20